MRAAATQRSSHCTAAVCQEPLLQKVFRHCSCHLCDPLGWRMVKLHDLVVHVFINVHNSCLVATPAKGRRSAVQIGHTKSMVRTNPVQQAVSAKDQLLDLYRQHLPPLPGVSLTCSSSWAH
eukprot:GHRQ01033924.1.p1 GENE.GHRQ01033924.1~~GHRQ01033924.1.p1  ORF type:complete len:121 (-),score=6.98 GHRQ01033924.1:213-575(-)